MPHENAADALRNDVGCQLASGLAGLWLAIVRSLKALPSPKVRSAARTKELQPGTALLGPRLSSTFYGLANPDDIVSELSGHAF